MAEPLTKGHTAGTHRLVPPEDTLARITPYLAPLGITRCAYVTYLDHLGIPVYCAIRPQGLVLQVSNGKGLRHVDAQVSALMEAIELHHAEHPAVPLRRASLLALRHAGEQVIAPETLGEYASERYFTPDFVVDWIESTDLHGGATAWLPASAVYLCWPTLYRFSTNGLASGNHVVEATLHALYEVIERDAMSRLSINGRLHIAERCQVVDVQSVASGPVHTFCAMLLDHSPFSHASRANVGYGTHLSPDVAATRAITEAAQVRLARIHGAREDLPAQGYQGGEAHDRVFAFFDRLVGETPWDVFADYAGSSLQQDYNTVLTTLTQAGFRQVWRAVLTRAPFEIPVVKVFVPGMEMKSALF
jgi:ribosomal protein S12 methylthiotransferase accessory factor